MRLFLFAAAAVLLGAVGDCSKASAEILRRVPAALDPAKAYLVAEIRNQDEGRQRGVVVIARYDPEGRDVRGGARSPESALERGADVRISIGSRSLASSDASRLYLVELEPDTWVIEGAGGTAFSLGSRTFTVVPGDVIDLGVLSPQADLREGEELPGLTAGRLIGMAFLGPFARTPEPRPARLEIRERRAGDLPLPEALRARVAPAQLRDGATFGNYLGGLVNRIDGHRGRRPAEPAAEPETPAAPPAETNDQ